MKLIIIVEGGIVQEVYADTPGAEIVLVDHDTEGVDEDEITIIDAETQSGAVIGSFPVTPIASLDPDISTAIKNAGP